MDFLSPYDVKKSNFLYQATAELKQAFKDPAIIPALCAVMTGSQNPQVSYCYSFNSLGQVFIVLLEDLL